MIREYNRRYTHEASNNMQGDQTLHTLIKSLYGLSTSPVINGTTAAVGVAAALLVPMNPRRVGLTIINNSLTWIRVLCGQLPTATNGIYIGAGGNSLTLRWDIDFELISLDWYAIAGGAASAVTTIENVSY